MVWFSKSAPEIRTALFFITCRARAQSCRAVAMECDSFNKLLTQWSDEYRKYISGFPGCKPETLFFYVFPEKVRKTNRVY